MTTQQPQDDPTRTPAWGTLASLAAGLAGTTIRDLVDADGGRTTELLAVAAGIHLDYSRQRVTGDVVDALLQLAAERGVGARRDQMLAGVHINTTEDRAVLHTALRRPAGDSLIVDGDDVVAQVNAVLDRMSAFAQAVRDGQWRGATGQRIAAVVNVGIGGSDLGPAMAHVALEAFSQRDLDFRFVSNVDPTDMSEALRDLDPASTLVIVASKTNRWDRNQPSNVLPRAVKKWSVTSAPGSTWKPVSSNTSRTRPSRRDSSNSIPPPGSDHSGSLCPSPFHHARRTRSCSSTRRA